MKIVTRKLDRLEPSHIGRIDIIICAVFLASFFLFYTWSSIQLSRTNVFSADGILFEIDTRRAVSDITQFSGNHYRTTVHPLFELFVNPPGELLQKITGSSLLSAILLNSFAGALGTAAAYIFFLTLKNGRLRAALFSVFFGVTAGQFFHAIIPDTSIFATLSLMVTYLLFSWSLTRGEVSLPIWIIAGILTLGTTTTNFAQTFFCFAIACLASRGHRNWKTLANRLVFFSLSVIGITVALSLVQKVIYPLSNPFFMPFAYAEESDYASLLIFQMPDVILRLLARDFFLVNFIAPYPDVYDLPGRLFPTVSFELSTSFSPVGIIAGLLWLALAVLALQALITRVKTKPTAICPVTRWIECGFVLCVFFNLAMHSVYGAIKPGDIHYFLFSGNFTFPVLALFTLFQAQSRWINALWLTLITCAIINNLQVLFHIVNLY
ncbi:hypothetical protein hrd7_33660 (plasmid) [Leptolinea sp. HRD-7]|nr:hypothetical protein hrd7_33660 [Leptolinea sp. HRD-7]